MKILLNRSRGSGVKFQFLFKNTNGIFSIVFRFQDFKKRSLESILEKRYGKKTPYFLELCFQICAIFQATSILHANKQKLFRSKDEVLCSPYIIRLTIKIKFLQAFILENHNGSQGSLRFEVRKGQWRHSFCPRSKTSLILVEFPTT